MQIILKGKNYVLTPETFRRLKPKFSYMHGRQFTLESVDGSHKSFNLTQILRAIHKNNRRVLALCSIKNENINTSTLLFCYKHMCDAKIISDYLDPENGESILFSMSGDELKREHWLIRLIVKIRSCFGMLQKVKAYSSMNNDVYKFEELREQYGWIEKVSPFIEEPEPLFSRTQLVVPSIDLERSGALDLKPLYDKIKICHKKGAYEQVFGLERGCEQRAISRAFRKLVQEFKLHPDQCVGSTEYMEAAHALFVCINEIKDKLLKDK